MKKRSLRCIIGIVILMLFSVFVLSGCTKKKEEDQKDTGVKENLQVEESDENEESPNVEFEDVFSNQDEKGKTNQNKEEVKQEDNKDSNKEEVKQEDNKDSNKEVLEDAEDNKDTGWGAFY